MFVYLLMGLGLLRVEKPIGLMPAEGIRLCASGWVEGIFAVVILASRGYLVYVSEKFSSYIFARF